MTHACRRDETTHDTVQLLNASCSILLLAHGDETEASRSLGLLVGNAWSVSSALEYVTGGTTATHPLIVNNDSLLDLTVARELVLEVNVAGADRQTEAAEDVRRGSLGLRQRAGRGESAMRRYVRETSASRARSHCVQGEGEAGDPSWGNGLGHPSSSTSRCHRLASKATWSGIALWACRTSLARSCPLPASSRTRCHLALGRASGLPQEQRGRRRETCRHCLRRCSRRVLPCRSLPSCSSLLLVVKKIARIVKELRRGEAEAARPAPQRTRRSEAGEHRQGKRLHTQM